MTARQESAMLPTGLTRDIAAPQLAHIHDTCRSYCVAVIYDGDAIEIEVLAHSAVEAMEVAEQATSELLPGWTELVLICEPDPQQTRNNQ